MKVVGKIALDLEVLIVKATTHDHDPINEKHIQKIMNLTYYSHGYASANIAAILERLSKTCDWIVLLKALVLVHRLLVDGHSSFEEEVIFLS